MNYRPTGHSIVLKLEKIILTILQTLLIAAVELRPLKSQTEDKLQYRQSLSFVIDSKLRFEVGVGDHLSQSKTPFRHPTKRKLARDRVRLSQVSRL